MKQSTSNRKQYAIILVAVVVLEFAFTCLIVRLVNNTHISQMGKRGVQAASYLLIIALSLVMTKLAGLSLREIGVFKDRIGLQAGIGAGITVLFVLLLLMTGWRPHDLTVHSFFSFALVGFSEELFSRGLVLKLLQELIHSGSKAVVIQAVIFGLFHLFIYQSISQCIIPFFIALIYGALRTEFLNTVGVFALAIAHWLYDFLL